MDLLQQLKAAQQGVDELRNTGVDMTSRQARRAMNRLVTLLRRARPDELESFDRWKKESTSHPTYVGWLVEGGQVLQVKGVGFRR